MGSYLIYNGRHNYDEGWYLLTAKLFSGGQQPYIDFPFTQGPGMLFFYGALFKLFNIDYELARWIQLLLLTGFLGVFMYTVKNKFTPPYFLLLATILLFNSDFIYFNILVKTYALSLFFLGMAFYYDAIKNKHFTAFVFMLLAASTRMSLAIFPLAYLISLFVQKQNRIAIKSGLTLVLGLGAFFLWIPPDVFFKEAFLFHTEYQYAMNFGLILKYVWESFMPVFILSFLGIFSWMLKRKIPDKKDFFWFVSSLFVALVQLMSSNPQAEYLVVVYPFLIYPLLLNLSSSFKSYFPAILGLTAMVFFLPYSFGISYGTRVPAKPIAQLKEKENKIQKLLGNNSAQVLDADLLPYISREKRDASGLPMGPFSLRDKGNPPSQKGTLTAKELCVNLSQGSYNLLVWSESAFKKTYPSGKPNPFYHRIKLIIQKNYILVDSLENYGQFFEPHYFYVKK